MNGHCAAALERYSNHLHAQKKNVQTTKVIELHLLRDVIEPSNVHRCRFAAIHLYVKLKTKMTTFFYYFLHQLNVNFSHELLIFNLKGCIFKY